MAASTHERHQQSEQVVPLFVANLLSGDPVPLWYCSHADWWESSRRWRE